MQLTKGKLHGYKPSCNLFGNQAVSLRKEKKKHILRQKWVAQHFNSIDVYNNLSFKLKKKYCRLLMSKLQKFIVGKTLSLAYFTVSTIYFLLVWPLLNKVHLLNELHALSRCEGLSGEREVQQRWIWLWEGSSLNKA